MNEKLRILSDITPIETYNSKWTNAIYNLFCVADSAEEKQIKISAIVEKIYSDGYEDGENNSEGIYKEPQRDESRD